MPPTPCTLVPLYGSCNHVYFDRELTAKHKSFVCGPEGMLNPKYSDALGAIGARPGFIEKIEEATKKMSVQERYIN